MNIFLDSQNFVNEFDNAPDKLRAEIGTYYGTNPVGQTAVLEKSTGKIEAGEITEVVESSNVLIPSKKQRIYFYGVESNYRDHVQWREYVNSIVGQGIFYADHTYAGFNISIANNFKNNYFRPSYEDLSKNLNTNVLLNYNLLNYQHNDKAALIRDFSVLRNQFDLPTFEVKSNSAVRNLLGQYQNRLNNFTGSLREVSERQRNIFVLTDDVNSISTEPYYIQNSDPIPPPFPYHYEKEISIPQDFFPRADLRSAMRNRKIDKFIHQSVKSNLSFQNVSFRLPGGGDVSIKTHNIIDIILRDDLVNFNTNFDETFLLEEDELQYDSPFDRFVNGVRAVSFISDFRSYLTPRAKNINEIFDSIPCEYEVIGYKIEKYIDNDLTLPTQTYFVNKLNYKFIDTQLKYGRKYIYKTFALVAIVGSAYRYSNLHASDEGGIMLNLSTNAAAQQGTFAVDSQKKYAAYVDVEIQPSFQIAEIPLDNHEEMFYDLPIMPPEVTFFNEKGSKTLRAILRPNPNANYDVTNEFLPLLDSDSVVSDNLKLSRDNIYGTVFASDYFTGRYQVYRMSTPPLDIKDFANNFLTEVDMSAKIINGESKIERLQNNQIAHFEDDLVPNRRYYYLFRALTYHGTPSNYTNIFEVEFLEDSDETKINVSEYKIPVEKNFVYRKMSKRIIKISPNLEHLIFDGDEMDAYSALANLGILENKLLYPETVNTYKIRITSKHTGKKMDINLNVKLKDKINT